MEKHKYKGKKDFKCKLLAFKNELYINTKEKGKVYFKNIHFMHLEFNTLPENKKYISGCQCSFCLKERKNKNLYLYYDQSNFVKKNLGFSEYEHYNMNYWNQYSDIIGGMRIFDPLS